MTLRTEYTMERDDPPSARNVFDSYSEALLAAGRIDEARSNCEHSLQLDPGNGNAAGVLKRLQAEAAAPND